ncbi:MAG: hypothetical protein K2W92_00645 [Alphaproteobacteria bacterium]|nr:hypothetical protein [Alphaproteobacteria bacterium]
MKITLTALSLMLVLGSVSAVQATVAPAATQHTEVATDVSATRNIAAKDAPAEPALAPSENPNQTVYTHLGATPVDSGRVDHDHPEGTKR